jgi:hypothetical protein
LTGDEEKDEAEVKALTEVEEKDEVSFTVLEDDTDEAAFT